MALETDFNVSPYYDDYDESKDYHKVLFKPAVALQARELTQLQTILQNQVEKFGHYVFKEGSIVKGCVFGFSRSIDYVKLLDKTIAGTDLNVSLIVLVCHQSLLCQYQSSLSTTHKVAVDPIPRGTPRQ